MRVIVTGSEGYIGCVLVPRLATAGHTVVPIDACWFDRTDGRLDDDRPAPRRADIRDLSIADFEGVDAVIHLAALSNDPLGEFDPAMTMAINHLATVRLAELAREAGVRRFIFSSSCSVYGRSAETVDECSPCDPQTTYARSKLLAERDLLDMAQPGFSPIVLRFGTAYGVSPCQRLDLVVPNLVASALTTGRVTLQSDGSAWRPLIHIQDMAAAFAAMLTAPLDVVAADAFNVGRDEDNHRVREIAEAIADAMPGCKIETAAGAAPDQRTYRVSFDRLRRSLPGFAPRWNLRAGVQECVAAFKRTTLPADCLSSPTYIRLRQLRRLLDGGYLDGSLKWTAKRRAGTPPTAPMRISHR